MCTLHVITITEWVG